MLLFIYLYFLLLHNPQECTLCYEVRFGRLLKFQTSLDTKLPKPWSSKTHHNNKNNQTDTPPQIPEKNAESNKKDMNRTRGYVFPKKEIYWYILWSNTQN